VFCLVYTFNNTGTNTGTETLYVGGVPVAARTGSVPAWTSAVGWRLGTQDGSSLASNSNFLGDLARLAIYNRVLTAAEIQAISRDASVNYAAARVFFEGDSLTAGTGATNDGDYPSQVVSAGPSKLPVEFFNVSIGGTGINDMTTRAPTTIDPYLVPGQNNVVVLFTGANDLHTLDGPTEYAKVTAYLAARKAAGRAIGASVRTVLVLAGPDTRYADSYETNRQAYLALVRANALASGTVDALVDYANDPYIGLASSKADQGSYWLDNVHLTNAGYSVLAGHVRHALFGLLFPNTRPDGGFNGGLL
jgi:lysophospholipase L1-like esterase